jgi:hypothetical protein
MPREEPPELACHARVLQVLRTRRELALAQHLLSQRRLARLDLRARGVAALHQQLARRLVPHRLLDVCPQARVDLRLLQDLSPLLCAQQ